MFACRITVISALSIALFACHSPAQTPPAGHPAALLPNPPSLAKVAETAESIMSLQVQVLEIQQARMDDAQALVRGFVSDPTADDTDGTLFLLGKDNKRARQLVAQMLDAKLADVVSRPQLITSAGKTAEIQVGQQIPVPPGKDGASHQQLGLSFACTPQRVADPSRIRLAINCSYSTADEQEKLVVKGKAYPIVHQQTLETTVEADSGETLVIRGPGENMLLVVTPKWVSQPASGVKQATFWQQPADVQPAKATASLLDDLVRMQDSLDPIEGVQVLSLEIIDDQLAAELLLADAVLLKEITAAFATQARIKIRSAQLANSGNGSRLQLRGEVIGSLRAPAGGDEAIRMLRRDVQAIGQQIKRLDNRSAN